VARRGAQPAEVGIGGDLRDRGVERGDADRGAVRAERPERDRPASRVRLARRERGERALDGVERERRRGGRREGRRARRAHPPRDGADRDPDGGHDREHRDRAPPEPAPPDRLSLEDVLEVLRELERARVPVEREHGHRTRADALEVGGSARGSRRLDHAVRDGVEEPLALDSWNGGWPARSS